METLRCDQRISDRRSWPEKNYLTTQREHMMLGNSFPWGLLAVVDGFPARSQHILKGRKTDRRH
jgi:hypothetical protein